MNTPHNCHRHGCGPTGQRQVIQERQQTDRLVSFIEHNSHPEDCILNLAQMHNSIQVQAFRNPTAAYTMEERQQLLEDSARREAQRQRSHLPGTNTGGRGRATPGRGRGRGQDGFPADSLRASATSGLTHHVHMA